MGFSCLDVTTAAGLDAPKQKGQELLFPCPRHKDEHPSLSINPKKDCWLCGPCGASGNAWQLAAFLAGCHPDEKEKVTRWLKQHKLLDGNTGRSRIVAEYIYVDADGKPALKVLRYEPKAFKQQMWDGTSWSWKGKKPKLLYHLPEILAAPKKWVLLCEGEKDVDRLISLGFVATCNPGGAEKWDDSYTESLTSNPVAIFPDNDLTGRRGAIRKAKALLLSSPDLRIVELPGLTDKEDLSDWLDAGHSKEELKECIRNTQPLDEIALGELKTRWLGETGEEGDKQPAASISEILTTTGWDDLTTDSPIENIEKALRNLSQHLQGADRLRLMTVREEAAKRLKDIGVSSSKAMVDAAIKRTGPEDKREQDEGVTPFLVEVEPSEEPVNGAEILAELEDFIGRYFILPKGATTTLALWVTASWLYRTFYIFPYLKIYSPMERCGKSNLLTTIGYMSYRPIKADGITPSALFRTVEKYGGTLLLDELDAAGLRYDHEKRALLNSGYSADGSVLRSVKTKDGDFDVRPFATYSPKALCGIGDFLPATVKDRAIPILMNRKTKNEKTDRWRGKQVKKECIPLAQKLGRWANDNRESVKNAREPVFPVKLSDRAIDIWESLFVIAGVIGGHWPEKVNEAALILNGNTDDEELNIRVNLLVDLKKLFDADDRLASTAIVAELAKMEDRPWPEYQKGRPLTTRQLSKLLKSFQIGPKPLWIDGKTTQGYERNWFIDAFDRYLPVKHPDSDTQDTQESSADKGLGAISDTQEKDNPWVSENAGHPHEQDILGDLGDKTKGAKRDHRTEDDWEVFE